MEDAQNLEALESGKSELKDLMKQKKILEIQIKTLLGTVSRRTHETLAEPLGCFSFLTGLSLTLNRFCFQP